MKKILLLGVGWLGEQLVNSLLNDQYVIYVGTSDIGKWGHLENNVKIMEVNYHSNKPFFSENLNGAECFDDVIVMLPPSGFDDYEKVILKICESFPNINHLIFTSSTGIYQNTTGIVDEDSKVDENNMVYRAEQAIKKIFPKRHTILRLSGLVSEDRHPVKYLLQKDIVSGGKTPVNLVHREDVIRAIKLLLSSSSYGETFNLSYPDHPCRDEYYNSFARRFYQKEINFSNEGIGKTIDGSKFAKYFEYEYLMSIRDIEINNN